MISEECRLQVLICTFGVDGIRRVCNSAHPEVDGVRYLVSWQQPDGPVDVPEGLEAREDFEVVVSATRGLSRNRNIALDAATAPLVLISDDDVSYTADRLGQVIEAFEDRPESDLITMQYECSGDKKTYIGKETNLRYAPKKYYVSSIEIAFRLGRVRESGLRFNERFGIGAEFIAGEEQIFIDDALRAGLECRYVPRVICRHDGTTTSDRHFYDHAYIATKGAVFSRLFRFTWPLRMLTHALRNAGGGKPVSRPAYLRAWLDGVSRFRRPPTNERDCTDC